MLYREAIMQHLYADEDVISCISTPYGAETSMGNACPSVIEG